MLESTLRLFNATAVPPGNKPIDPRADPKYVFFPYKVDNWLFAKDNDPIRVKAFPNMIFNIREGIKKIDFF